MVEVGVGDEQEIGADEGFRGDGGGCDAGDADGFVFDAHPDALGEDRIDRDRHIVYLSEDGSMPEPENGEVMMGQFVKDLGKVDRLVGIGCGFE